MMSFVSKMAHSITIIQIVTLSVRHSNCAKFRTFCGARKQFQLNYFRTAMHSRNKELVIVGLPCSPLPHNY